MVWLTSTPDNHVYVLHGAEEGTSGYLVVKALGAGVDGEVALIRSIDTGELAVRKFPLLKDPNNPSIRREQFLPSNEVLWIQSLTNSGITPRYISVEGPAQFPRSLTMEYADGGSVHEYWINMLRNESRETREAFLWLVMAKMLETFVYLQSGFTYVPPPSGCWHHRIPKGKFVPPSSEHQPWVPAIHSDAHMANVFVTFAAERGCSAKMPAILLGDFSRADHKHNFFCPNSNMEFVELDYFLEGLLGLHPRPSLAIERKADEIRKRMAKGESLLELVQDGIHDECLYSFAQLDAPFPQPKAVAGGGKAKVFDLSKGLNYIANLWGFREAVKVGAKSLRVLRIPRDDVSEQGQVDINRAEYVSRSELCRLIGIPDDDGSDTDDPSDDDDVGEA